MLCVRHAAAGMLPGTLQHDYLFALTFGITTVAACGLVGGALGRRLVGRRLLGRRLRLGGWLGGWLVASLSMAARASLGCSSSSSGTIVRIVQQSWTNTNA